VLTRVRTVLPATHTFIHKWNEWLKKRWRPSQWGSVLSFNALILLGGRKAIQSTKNSVAVTSKGFLPEEVKEENQVVGNQVTQTQLEDGHETKMAF